VKSRSSQLVDDAARGRPESGGFLSCGVAQGAVVQAAEDRLTDNRA
jgi:hypothetical protein